MTSLTLEHLTAKEMYIVHLLDHANIPVASYTLSDADYTDTEFRLNERLALLVAPGKFSVIPITGDPETPKFHPEILLDRNFHRALQVYTRTYSVAVQEMPSNTEVAHSVLKVLVEGHEPKILTGSSNPALRRQARRYLRGLNLSIQDAAIDTDSLIAF